MNLSAYPCASADVLTDTAKVPGLEAQMAKAIDWTAASLGAGLPMLACGNGGSAADAQHIAGELVGRFLRERRALNVHALTADTAVLTALGDDYGFERAFAHQIEAHGRLGGVLPAIPTSGNSANVLTAAETARRTQMKVVALTVGSGGKLGSLAHALLAVPSRRTPRIQEAHTALYHYLCEAVEARVMARDAL